MASKNTLHFGDQFKLANFIQAEYASSEMFDDKFAELATKKLGFAVTVANIGSIRRSLGVPSNFRSQIKEPDTKRLERLEDEVRKLWVQVQHLIDGTKP